MSLEYFIPLHFVLLLLTFYTLCIICDDYLVPAVEVFIKQFKVPEEVAAVTLVAFGSAAPELFLNSVSAVTHTSDLSLSAILGSGMIAFGLIPPLCFLSIHHEEVSLKLRPILRECGFYILGLSIFLCSMHDGKIAITEAMMIVAVYFCYVGLVIHTYLSSSDGLQEVASLQDEMMSSNQLINNTGQSHLPLTGSSGSIKPNTMGSGYLRDVEQQQDCSPNDEQSTEQSQLLSYSSTQMDVETAVTTAGDSHICERTVNCINRGISLPIQYVLSKVLPQLHPPPDTQQLTPAAVVASAINFKSQCESLGPNRSSSPSTPHKNYRDASNNNNSSSNNSSNSSGRSSNGSMSPPPVSTSSKTSSPTSNSTNNTTHSAEFVPLWRAILVLVTSIVCVGLLASAIVALSEGIVKKMGIDTSTMGATLVALGAEIPDTVSSVALARSGYFDGAIAGAIGSQVINISLGVGLPALFVGLTGNGFLTIAADQVASLWLLTCLLFVVITSYVAVTIPVVLMYTQRVVPQLTAVGKAGAVIQIFVWCSVYVVFIYSNESERR